jgi:hypothetical protein
MRRASRNLNETFVVPSRLSFVEGRRNSRETIMAFALTVVKAPEKLQFRR